MNNPVHDPKTESGPITRRISRALTTDSVLHQGPVAIHVADHALDDPYVQQVVIGITEAARRNQLTVRAPSHEEDDDSSAVIRVGPSQRPEDDFRPQVRVGQQSNSDGITTFSCDDAGGAASLVESLRELGHRRIAFIGGPSGPAVWQERRRGWHEAMIAGGLQADLEIEVASECPTVVSQTVLAAWRGGLRCTAMCAASDTIASGIYRAADELGLRIPRDLSITGFDDLESAARLIPALTTIQVPKQGLGMAAIEALIQLADQGEPPSRQLPLRLIRRASVAAPLLP